MKNTEPNKKEVSKVMDILEKQFHFTKRTTLNRMRKKPNAFKILISCLLSLRTQDKNTEKASNRLFAVADTPQEISRINTKKLESLIFSSGHYKKKARVLKEVSKVILEKYNGKVPDKKEELLSIKGIGPKTANIVLSFAYGQEVIPVDVHVHVITNRLGWVKENTPEKTEKALEKVLPRRYWKEINALFVLFGKEICDTRSPKCSICPIRYLCPRKGIIRSR